MKQLFFVAVMAVVMSSCSFASESEDCACKVNGSNEEIYHYDEEDCSSLSNEDETCRAI
ncbi:MAG: hypothetical protein MJZ19_06765 [Paludibacteraceae bacterium]|nr:hypothetical protein [Paludibacteraceae bacterium]